MGWMLWETAGRPLPDVPMGGVTARGPTFLFLSFPRRRPGAGTPARKHALHDTYIAATTTAQHSFLVLFSMGRGQPRFWAGARIEDGKDKFVHAQ